MALFVISYDLIKRKDYQTLWDELDRLNGQKALNSFYLINLNSTAAQVRDHFKDFIDDDDRLIVVEFSKEPKFTKALKGTTKWIEENV
ncbi:MAG: hypothetical protein WD407_06205 [Rhodospirillales bacterium]